VTTVRHPAVAGLFYPDGSAALRSEVERLLGGAPRPAETPKALIVPHAGYVYSGPVAASAYAALGALRGTISRVVLLGPCHRVAVRGLAAPSVDAFVTPLGQVPLDRTALERVLALPQVVERDDVHAEEHSLEVHLPFLQVALGDFRLVPLAVGDATPEQVAEVLDALWGGPETLLVVSTDLSHYYDYARARALDAETCRAIEELRPEALGSESACGRYPLRGLLVVARRRGMHVRTLDLRSSGDTAGPRDRVVGYGAWLVA
jgi:AmmeMemoRadiSam system protein B